MVKVSQRVKSCSTTKHVISNTTMPMSTKLGRVVNYRKGSHPESHITIRSCGLVRLCDKQNQFVFTAIICLATKRDRMVTDLKCSYPQSYMTAVL